MKKAATIVFFFTIISLVVAQPEKPAWPKGFRAPNTIIAFDEESEPHIHESMFYYSYYYYNGSYHGAERHDHKGYCYGWGDRDCTILIIGNVYIIAKNPDLCCNALSGNFGVPINWLSNATWLGEEVVRGQKVNHWYFFEHEYWSSSQPPFDGVQYAGPNFKTPRQFTLYDPWEYGPQDPSLFQLPEGVDCSKPCPH